MRTKTYPMRIERISEEASEIRRFDLAMGDGSPLPPFEAGAHIDVHLSGSLIRQYSLCNGPSDRLCFTIAVKREPASRGGSGAMHDSFKQGDTIEVSGPRNHFPIHAAATQHLLLAGGIGVTPLLSMARHLRAAGATFRMKYYVRSAEHAAFRQLLCGPEFSDSVELRCGVQPETLAPELETLLAARQEGTHVYICGPGPFMALAEEIAAHSYPGKAIHSEHFSAHPVDARASKGFVVELARSGKRIEVSSDESIVDALCKTGVYLDTLCRQGVCGTCQADVLEGVPDHRDAYLTDDERRANTKVLTCCSRSLTPILVLDL